jgi:hypothetical protein
VTVVFPTNVVPSSVPAGLEKNWMMKEVLSRLFSMPLMVVLSAVFLGDESTGRFCKALAPGLASPGSLGVGPSLFRSLSRPPLEKMELCDTRLPVVLLEFRFLCAARLAFRYRAISLDRLRGTQLT